jgi:hypothetical protein
MKKALLTSIITFTAIFANAQGTEIALSEFSSKVNLLTSFIAQKNNAGQNDAFRTLNELMNSQMTYLTAYIAAAKTAMTADAVSADSSMRAAMSEKEKAEADLAKSEALINSGQTGPGQTAMQNTQNEIIIAKRDKEKEQAKRNDADREKARFQICSDKLAIEKNAYNDMQPLKNNILSNKDRILGLLKLFASTLH